MFTCTELSGLTCEKLTDEEICCLLAIWSKDAFQREFNGCYRKDPMWQKIAQELKRQNSNFECHLEMQCNAIITVTKNCVYMNTKHDLIRIKINLD